MFGADGLGGLTGCFSKAGLTVAGTSTKIKIAAPNGAGVDFSIEGVAYHKADTDNITMNAASQQAVSTSCLYLVELDADGNLTVKKGKEELTASLGDNLSIQWPAPSADKCPIGGFKIALNASTTFTLGTTALDAAGVTDTYYDFLGGVPVHPQVA